MSARDAVLGRVRRALGVSGADPARRAAVADRLARAPRGVIPARGQLPPDEQLTLFLLMAERAYATVRRVRADEIPGAIVDFLAEQRIPPVVRMGTDPRLAAIDWEGSGLEVLVGRPSPDDLATVSHAESGIAETGTLLLTSGPANPTLLGFLARAHTIVVDAGAIVGDPETALERLQRTRGKGPPPRNVTFVTGPSRSGDIEQTMYLGAHGPQSLLVLVVDP